MPFTLALYIGRVFLVNMVLVFICFLAMIYLGDITELMRRAASQPDLGFATVAMIGIYKLPGTSQVALPFAVLIACLMGFHRLARHNELAVLRAAGVSVWQFTAPACVAAALFGLFSVVVYNPLAAAATAAYQRMEAEHYFGQREGNYGNVGGQVWLRQANSIGSAVMNAERGLERGTALYNVVVYQFDRGDRFLSRIKADRALYHPGRWRLEEAWVVGRSGEPAYSPEYWVETSLSRTQVAESLGSAAAISFWDLPEFIAIAERAGLAANEYRVHYNMLLARPALFAAIVLLAAVFALRPPRFGQAVRLIVVAPVLAIVLFLVDHVSTSLGGTGSLHPIIAAWWAVVFAALVSLTALFFQEDG